MKISIIGMGFVGRALYNGLSPYHDIRVYDKYNPSYPNLEEVVNHSNIIFVCVPTPVRSDESQDLSNIYDVFNQLKPDRFSSERKIIVIKSTIIPGTCDKLYGEYGQYFDIIFNPEFLTERTSILDFLNQSRIVLGGNNPTALDEVERVYKEVFVSTPIYKVGLKEAELVKYVCNCYFATKVSFSNEISLICDKLGIDYETIRMLWTGDQRITESHTKVPGFDGYHGYGGKCLLPEAEVKVNGVITNMEKLFSSIENRNKYFIEGTNFDIDKKENKEIEKFIENNINDYIYEFELENCKVFKCTKHHLIPVIRNNKKMLLEAQNIINTDLFFVE